jgi:type II secretory pathway pseudopilin PulG
MEMLVVMAIIGLVAAVAMPSVGAGIESVRLATATQSISAFLNSAVNYAERHQQAVDLVITPKENRFSAYSADGGFTRDLTLPDGITLESVQPEITELMLLPGGTVPGIALQIANRRGSRRLVRLDPMTGFPRVTSVETK